jgi:hypothetical protein
MLRVVAAALFLIVAFAASAFACDCIAPPEPPEALKKSDAVFVGKVTSIARGNSHWRSVTFEVEKTWKGVEGKSVHVVTRLNSAACGFSFEDGKSYLVYANFVGGDGPDAKTLSTNICTRTTFVSEATKAEFEALGPAKMREP